MHNLLDSTGIQVKDAVLRLHSGVYAWSSYLGEVGNGDDTSLLPSVVGMRPISTKERKAMLTLCPPLPTLRSCTVFGTPERALQKTGFLSTIVDMTE